MRSPWVSWTLATLLILGLGFGAWLIWQTSLEAQPADAELIEARVTRVVDGDTIEVTPPVEGVEDVRLIGVDTPEVFGEEEPCGLEASAFTTEQLEGESVTLEFDEERTDQFGRALAYVYLDGELYNETLVRQGYAQVLTIPPNTRYEDRFLTAEEQARAEGLGIWGPGGCGASTATPEPAPEQVPSSPETSPAPRDAPVERGNLMEAGGPMEPPYPTMMDDSCPQEFPVERADGCYPR